MTRSIGLVYLILSLQLFNPTYTAIAEEPPKDAKIAISFAIETPNSEPVEMAAEVAFIGDYAVAAKLSESSDSNFNFSEGTVFDLKSHAWHEPSTNTWINMEACKKWEQASQKRTKASLEAAPNDDVQPFIESMISPNIEVQELENGDLSISNSKLKYVVSPGSNVPATLLEKFHAYDRLNAYHKAMTEKGFPPTPQLAVTKILSKRKIFPGRLDATIGSPGGDVKVTTAMVVEDLGDEEAREAASAIRQTQ